MIGSTFSAFRAGAFNSGNSIASGSVKLTDNDSGSAMFSLGSATTGDSDTSCIKVSYQGSLPATVRQYATVGGSLASSLSVKVTRGSGTTSFDDCTGFSADATNYIGAGAGVVYDGYLSDFPGTYAAGIADPLVGATFASSVLGEAGLVSFWRLGERPGAASAVDVLGVNHGSYLYGVTQGVGGAIDDGTTAAQLDGSDDYVRVNRQIQDDFSIELWLKSTQGLNTSSQWSGNAGLVDADVAGTRDDFGVSLRSDGRITAGVGNPDTTVVSSSSGYNDGNWHHVVFTRTRSTGAIKLYVDGASAGTAVGGTQSLTAATTISFGRAQGSGTTRGVLDDVAVYNIALTATDVSDHWLARTRAPEIWTTSETHDYKIRVGVDNTAGVGQSATAALTWEARNQ